jgi:hypothetical protein
MRASPLQRATPRDRAKVAGRAALRLNSGQKRPGLAQPGPLGGVWGDEGRNHHLSFKCALNSEFTLNYLSEHTGEQALSILRTEPEKVDWLLTDIRLSGVIDG